MRVYIVKVSRVLAMGRALDWIGLIHHPGDQTFVVVDNWSISIKNNDEYRNNECHYIDIQMKLENGDAKDVE